MAEPPVRPPQPAARNTAPAAGKKPTSKKGGGKREEHTIAISSQVYGLVKNYKIDSGDNVLPKISGVLRATGALVHELLQEVKEGFNSSIDRSSANMIAPFVFCLLVAFFRGKLMSMFPGL